jgi:hypothetical protein
LVSESAGAARPGAAGSTPSVAPGSAADGVGAASGDSAAAAELAGATRCVTMGPYRDAGAAAQAASTLRTRGYDPRQRGVDEVPGGVWVYLPVPATPGGRDQLLAKLKAAGIGDALEMPGPTAGSVISLGVYGDQSRAQARIAQAHALGLSPALADRKGTGTVYWVDVDLKPTDGVPTPAKLLGEAGLSVRLGPNGCPAEAAKVAPGAAP